MRLSIKAHLLVSNIVRLIIFLVALVLGLWPLVWARQAELGGMLGLLAYASVIVIANLIGWALFRFAIMARCPKCGGAAYATGRPPTQYRCTECGHVETTNVFASKSTD